MIKTSHTAKRTFMKDFKEFQEMAKLENIDLNTNECVNLYGVYIDRLQSINRIKR